MKESTLDGSCWRGGMDELVAPGVNVNVCVLVQEKKVNPDLRKK